MKSYISKSKRAISRKIFVTNTAADPAMLAFATTNALLTKTCYCDKKNTK